MKATPRRDGVAPQAGRCESRRCEQHLADEVAALPVAACETPGQNPHHRRPCPHRMPRHPPLLVLPAVVEVGARWQSKSTQRHTITREGKPPEVTTHTIDRNCEVMLKEELTVPAGTFQTLRVDCAPVGGVSKAAIWYADGVGLIQYAESGAKLITHRVNK